MCVLIMSVILYVSRTVSTLGLSILYVYVFREYCLQLIMYAVNAQGSVERIINVRYYHRHYCPLERCLGLCKG